MNLEGCLLPDQTALEHGQSKRDLSTLSTARIQAVPSDGRVRSHWGPSSQDPCEDRVGGVTV